MMTYDEAVQYVTSFNNLPRGTLLKYDSPKRWYREYTKRMQVLLSLLGHPDTKIPHYIHIAGTSGKGSTATYMESILRASGKRTGMMISPYPTHIREQWQVNGRPIAKSVFAECVTKLRPMIDQFFASDTQHRLSLFDLETVIGLTIFAHAGVEWAVIEVGLGGRYDSTNIIPYKDAAIVTSIGLDHMEYLGNTKEKIAFEKSGIIISDSPVVTAVTAPRVQRVIARECAAHGAPLSVVPPRQIQVTSQTIHGTEFMFAGQAYSVRAVGRHQAVNAALCITVAERLGLPRGAIRRGLSRAVQPVRMEVVLKRPTIILDGAHNPDKMAATMTTLRDLAETNSWKKYHVIIGFSRDKNWQAMLRQILTLAPASVACTRNTANPFRRVANPTHVAAYVRKHSPGSTVGVFLDPALALAWSRTQLKKHDILLCTGSIFLSGELRPLLTSSKV